MPFVKRSVLNQHKAICCDHCNQWVHIKCNNLNDLYYNLLKSKNEFWYCILRPSEILPFCTVNSVISLPKGSLNKLTGALINLMNQLNNFTDGEKENELKLPSCKYRDLDYFQTFSSSFKRKTLSFFLMNLSSLTENFGDFNILLNDLNVNFDILAITESRIKKDSSSPINLHLDKYSVEQTPTETSTGGTLLYINKRLSYQLRNDLKLYYPGKTESTFIEIICSKSTNVIVGCICKHPTIQINDFKSDFISPLVLKL